MKSGQLSNANESKQGKRIALYKIKGFRCRRVAIDPQMSVLIGSPYLRTFLLS
jgi:hypothetical protein